MTNRQRPRTGTTPPARPPRRLSREAIVLLLIGAPVALAAIVLVTVSSRGGEDAPSNAVPGRDLAGSASQQALLVREDSPVLGAPTAPVTIVEFLDPECEACRAAFPGIKRLLAEYEGQIRLVVRYFPLHGNSVLAAQATEAAGEQGKYWEMQEALFTKQTQWGEKDTPQAAAFISYARDLGLDIGQFTAAMQSSRYTAKVERDRNDGTALGVRGTPTIFINGRYTSDFTYTGLKAAIDAALK